MKLAWCNRDDYGWCGMHNRPFGHCKAEALDTVASERKRIRDAVEGLLFDARMDGRGGVHDYIDRDAVLAIVNREDTDG